MQATVRMSTETEVPPHVLNVCADMCTRLPQAAMTAVERLLQYSSLDREESPVGIPRRCVIPMTDTRSGRVCVVPFAPDSLAPGTNLRAGCRCASPP